MDRALVKSRKDDNAYVSDCEQDKARFVNHAGIDIK